MFAYECQRTDEERKYLVVAEDTDEARALLADKLLANQSCEDRDAIIKSIQVKHASEWEMRQRFLHHRGGWGFPYKESHWQAYQRLKKKAKTSQTSVAKIVADYLC